MLQCHFLSLLYPRTGWVWSKIQLSDAGTRSPKKVAWEIQAKKTWTKHETEVEDEDARDFCNYIINIYSGETIQLNIWILAIQNWIISSGKMIEGWTLKNILCMYSRMAIYIHLFAQMKRDHEHHENDPRNNQAKTSNLTDKILYAALLDSGKALQWVQIDAFILYPHPLERVLHVFSPQLWSSCTMFGWKKCNRTKRRKGQLFHQA